MNKGKAAVTAVDYIIETQPAVKVEEENEKSKKKTRFMKGGKK